MVGLCGIRVWRVGVGGGEGGGGGGNSFDHAFNFELLLLLR